MIGFFLERICFFSSLTVEKCPWKIWNIVALNCTGFSSFLLCIMKYIFQRISLMAILVGYYQLLFPPFLKKDKSQHDTHNHILDCCCIKLCVRNKVSQSQRSREREELNVASTVRLSGWQAAVDENDCLYSICIVRYTNIRQEMIKFNPRLFELIKELKTCWGASQNRTR